MNLLKHWNDFSKFVIKLNNIPHGSDHNASMIISITIFISDINEFNFGDHIPLKN